ncbi:DNA-directed RNA polymerase III subunit RPC7 isoform X2 [Hyperolius riggenbachi]|uniref:DNA-directed RNA polymerase III subunit RPC7 isoform X2 n=1 Tax=Hyperolius riggenbachi TaxID=752182 RepID=UPI0035A32BA8
MAGKGRGRGSAFTFDIQSIGFSRGDALPETQLQPLPRFPHTEFKAAALPEGEEQDYLLALKQEMRGNVKKLAYYIKKGAANQGVERYITKYEIEAEQKLSEEWLPGVKKDKNKKPNINVDVLKKIEELEKKGDGEKSEEENEEKKKGSGDEEEEEAVEGEVEEEELEDENDYIASYFEDGDDFCASDDNMDEATY